MPQNPSQPEPTGPVQPHPHSPSFPQPPASSPDESGWPNPRYGWYVTFMLLLAFTFSFVDRQVLNLLVQPIQQDLGISDTQISLLQGLAFVFTYVGLSVPIGRMVDRFNRVAS